jgi:hypothetical protein
MSVACKRLRGMVTQAASGFYGNEINLWLRVVPPVRFPMHRRSTTGRSFHIKPGDTPLPLQERPPVLDRGLAALACPDML